VSDAGDGDGGILQGKVALVTGAASGIGRATAVAIARAGALAVAVLDLDADKCQDTERLVREAGALAIAITCDVADPDALAVAFADVEHLYGGIDLVHNNAGLVSGPPSWPATTLARAKSVMLVNLGGAVYGTQLGIAALRRRGGGAIVNTASLGGLAPSRDDAVYGAAKAGVIMLSRSCRALRREGIRVNVVCPGAVDSPMLRETGDGQPAAWLKGLGTLQLLTAEQVAEVVLQVATDDTCAGQAVIIDNPGPEAGGAPIVSFQQFADATPTMFKDMALRRDKSTSLDGGAPSRAMSLDEAIYTTRAMRRLRTDPVPADLLAQIVEAATMGPSGNLMQNWRFYIVTERDKIEKLGHLWSEIYERVRHRGGEMPETLLKSCEYMIEHFRYVPAVVLAGATNFPGREANHVMTTTWYASILPSVQNLMLSARARGLGTTLTTLLLAAHDDVRDIIGAADDVTLVACIPVGYPKGRFGRPDRNPTDAVAWLDGRSLPPPAITYNELAPLDQSTPAATRS
jgi:NAD(P)-dependent dehydrogenase (short-subunit alcohol dehydrogenase family)/nitroreductase